MPASICAITVIVPALNEAAGIRETLVTAAERLRDARVIVVDGGSTDATCVVAKDAGAEVLTSARGRGVQCHAGARASTSEWLLFLHADTVLPPNAAAVVGNFLVQANAQLATFRLRFDQGGWFLRACGAFTRFDSVFTRFGDQGILIRRGFYDELGGFPPWPLFEDVALLQRARRRGKIHSLPAAVTTSARRFQAHGHVRQQWRNARLLLRYLGGASPLVLAEEYRVARRAQAASVVAATPQEETTRA